MNTDSDYQQKQRIQADQYQAPYHWGSEKKVDAYRYKRMSDLLARLVAKHARSLGSKVIAVLDFGCGDGYGTYLIGTQLRARGIEADMYGLDVEETAIEWANQMTRQAGGLPIQFSVGDIELGVDLVKRTSKPIVLIMREVIEHLPEDAIDSIIQHINSTIPTAVLIVSVPSTNSPTEKKHFRHYTEQSLKETLARNNYITETLTGFGFRPARFYKRLLRMKMRLNRKQRFWWLMNPCWRVIRPGWAITLVAVAKSAVNHAALDQEPRA
jgi:2-polyprenyl-3-methyl-5-hydroxy-6-metoxy-1,4-benzoquinol methylase